jgi:hypothetical protein
VRPGGLHDPEERRALGRYRVDHAFLLYRKRWFRAGNEE